MGFAGQVFAARIAVGLAVPSASALSRTGGMLAKGAAGIYTALNSQRKAQASKRVSDAQAEVTKLTKLTQDNAARQSRLIEASARSGMRKLEASGEAGTAALAKGGATAFQGMKKVMGSEGKMFEGVAKLEKPIARLLKMTNNFTNMTKAQQKAAITQSKEYVTTRKKAVEVDEAKVKAFLKEKEETTKGWKRMTAGRRELMKGMDEEEKKLRKRVEVSRELRDAAVQEAEVVRVVATQAHSASAKIKEKDAKTTKELADAIDNLEKEEKQAAEATKDLTTSAANFGAQVTDIANDMAKNFNAVLLETVATLSAFYYKLNQNTEALMEFERELINANSVWQETDEVLFAAGEQVTQFGQTFGMNMQNGATGLYQLASAGLTAAESMEVLDNTLKLSMAVQGDHNTIAKLTTQTIRGFDMEMTDSAVVTDKFAHAIQKSLIEYEDLSSAVKFALPFFTSTGQSIDQLLGSLQVLTNRALEAGIAGRGLRQALAQFAKHAENNDAAFRKMGISVLNAEGNMRQLSDIAADFAAVVGEDTVNNTELLTSLIDDLNVRGATAFVHLVQASDEFTQAVEETAGAGGELDKMITEQNSSLTSQVQILKNNVQMIFQMTDATYVAEGYMNAFHKTVSLMIADLQGLIVEGEDGSKTLTDFGMAIQEIAVSGMKAMHEVLMEIIPIIKDFAKEGFLNVEMLRLYTLPLRIVVRALDMMGPQLTKLVMSFYIMNKILPITTALQIASNIVQMMTIKLLYEEVAQKSLLVGLTGALNLGYIKRAAIVGTLILMETGLNIIETIRSITLAGIVMGTWGYIVALGVKTKALILATGATYALGTATLIAMAPYIAMGIVIGAIVIGLGRLISNTGILQGAWTALTEPGGGLYRLIEGFKMFGVILAATWDLIKFIGGGIANIISLASSFKDAVMSPFNSIKNMGNFGVPGMATGGYIQPMATGGMASGGTPYLVGERGPELFRPNGGGQVLNNSATNHIMQQSADRGFSGAGGGMVVSNLTVESAEMNQSNLNIDSFAGNPAMRRRA
jgi:TP901 family phage tail tape measure protein